jgi:hypothetical protein
MIDQLTNASAMRVITAFTVVAGLTWLGDLASGHTTPASAYYYEGALIVVYVVVDHLHAIRAQLAAIASRPR